MRKDAKGQLLSFNPTGEYYFAIGMKAYQRKAYQKAIKYIQKAIRLEPYEPVIVCQLAIIYTELGKYEQSNELLHRILNGIDKEMVECHYFLATNYVHIGLFKAAYQHALRYLDLDKNGEFVEDAEELLDFLSLETDELEEYEEDEQIIKQEQARDFLMAGEFSKAKGVLLEMIKEYPENWSAYNNLALAHFYLNELPKAEAILNKVLQTDPGNLHALCNKIVFAYYEENDEIIKLYVDLLKKIRPISPEHQFKLGATFALVGEYECAFGFLRKLEKQGFEGDGSFYFWLSTAAYYTGKKELAEGYWKKVLDLSPDKKGQEPWNDNRLSLIIQKAESDNLEERLFAVFLTSVSVEKDAQLVLKALQGNQKMTALEEQYISYIQSGKVAAKQLLVAHETAQMLYRFHQPIGNLEIGLYLFWFSIVIEMMKKTSKIFKNSNALAAAVEYIWFSLRNVKITKKRIAEKYQLSSATLRKYVKYIHDYLG
ncbi:tetratricopeptide repeat protein [Bacillaceae bacterium Marseille-Q3522]|nr:tetratricopeptide repeat protein [Bacillaceae bacterium Marseille-Q3522]